NHLRKAQELRPHLLNQIYHGRPHLLSTSVLVHCQDGEVFFRFLPLPTLSYSNVTLSCRQPDRSLEAGRNRRFETERLSSLGMAKGELGGVERLAVRDHVAVGPSVDGIAHHGVADVGEVDPYLMGASRHQLEPEKGVTGEAP